jgi:hypothetical protein
LGPMNTAIRLFLPAALFSALIACGRAQPEPAVATTRTTAAFVVQQEDADKKSLQRLTDEQHALLNDERETRLKVLANQQEITDARREQDALAVRVAEAIENADLAIESARDAAQLDFWKKWPRVAKVTREAQRQKAKLLVDLRRLHSDLGMMTWPTFKADVERSLAELESAVAQARAFR